MRKGHKKRLPMMPQTIGRRAVGAAGSSTAPNGLGVPPEDGDVCCRALSKLAAVVPLTPLNTGLSPWCNRETSVAAKGKGRDDALLLASNSVSVSSTRRKKSKRTGRCADSNGRKKCKVEEEYSQEKRKSIGHRVYGIIILISSMFQRKM